MADVLVVFEKVRLSALRKVPRLPGHPLTGSTPTAMVSISVGPPPKKLFPPATWSMQSSSKVPYVTSGFEEVVFMKSFVVPETAMSALLWTRP